MRLTNTNHKIIRDKWKKMINRCDNTSDKMYHRYGGRGISVCPEWYDFFTFAHDLPDNYFKKAEIDRINNDGNYEPSNVRWVTKQTNCINRNTTVWLELNGEKKYLSQWADDIGIALETLRERLDNWSLDDALTKPKGTRLRSRWDGHTKPEKKPKKPVRLYWYKEKQYTMKELSELASINPKVMRKRINERKWSVSRAVETRLRVNNEDRNS